MSLLIVPKEIQCHIFKDLSEVDLINLIITDRNLEDAAGYVLRQRNHHITSVELSRCFHPTWNVTKIEINTDRVFPARGWLVVHHHYMPLGYNCAKRASEQSLAGRSGYVILHHTNRENSMNNVAGLLYAILRYCNVSLASVTFLDKMAMEWHCLAAPLRNFFKRGAFGVLNKISVEDMRLPAGLAVLLQFVAPMRLRFIGLSAELFDEKGKLLIGTMDRLCLLSRLPKHDATAKKPKPVKEKQDEPSNKPPVYCCKTKKITVTASQWDEVDKLMAACVADEIELHDFALWTVDGVVEMIVARREGRKVPKIIKWFNPYPIKNSAMFSDLMGETRLQPRADMRLSLFQYDNRDKVMRVRAPTEQQQLLIGWQSALDLKQLARIYYFSEEGKISWKSL